MIRPGSHGDGTRPGGASARPSSVCIWTTRPHPYDDGTQPGHPVSVWTTSARPHDGTRRRGASAQTSSASVRKTRPRPHDDRTGPGEPQCPCGGQSAPRRTGSLQDQVRLLPPLPLEERKGKENRPHLVTTRGHHFLAGFMV